ncbi:glycosyltransferase involved in cell wall biosynthesis [Janthinobacterium sp. S3M3]|nr:glycosyltransferase involved in cell wall biosynthesis [Janthinobacterium sp. S3T4]MBB5614125.1 glycosyltransferase involved in cell wall biosynthesis [Janthinobacterium sp. S3M3]
MKKIALMHEWYTTLAGSEKVMEQLARMYTQADLFAVYADPDFVQKTDFLRNRKLTTTFIQDLPRASKSFRSYLPLMPLAVEQLDLSPYDLVISSNHAVAKGVLTGPDQLHISYVHSPIRYAWDLQHQYLRESGLNRGFKGWLAKWLLHKMRIWDTRTANGVDHFVANSKFIARRIKKVYGRDADVIYPPVNINDFSLVEKKEEFYLTASRLVPYKKMDLIVEAFSHMPEKRLIVIGDGPDMQKIKAKAGKNIEMMGYQPFSVLKDMMQRAQAFVFAAEEDFGITPVEAQACGTPVIAFGKGGVLETVIDTGDLPTGVFFQEQTISSLCEAVTRFEKDKEKFIPKNCRNNAERFCAKRFNIEFSNYVENKWRIFSDSMK